MIVTRNLQRAMAKEGYGRAMAIFILAPRTRTPPDRFRQLLPTTEQNREKQSLRSNSKAASVGGPFHCSLDNGPRGTWSSPPVR
jgi:hypothetical protein